MNATRQRSLLNLELMLQAPSAFAEEAAVGVSPNYGFVSTERSIRILRRHGWVPVSAREQRANAARRIGFQKHMIRFRKIVLQKPIVGDTWPEIVLINSHDARSAFVLHAGLFRLACGNGLVVADKFLEEVRIRHTGFREEQMVAATEAVSARMPLIADSVQRMESRLLTAEERLAFARAAIVLRWGEESSVQPAYLLQVRRSADSRLSLWRSYNVIQENLVRGCSGARRGVRSIDGTLHLNKKLWELAAGYL